MGAHAVAYFKRFQMERTVVGPLPRPNLQAGCKFSPWRPGLERAHAEVKHRSFVASPDSRLFPCLGTVDGCERLMRDIVGRRGFLPEATWLAGRFGQWVGTIQGVRESTGLGTIQNLGVSPEARGLGLGRALLLQALWGFQLAGVKHVMLEVTAENTLAIRLYRRLGFRRTSAFYRGAVATEDVAS